MPAVPPELASKHLYIEHIARQLDAMDEGRIGLQPVAYRLYAKRLRAALAGYPPAQLARGLAREHASVMHALDERHYDLHGTFPGRGAATAREATRRIIARCSRG